ncbi:nucleotide exchange factor GrpE [Ligilactobacillus apodemi]|uniref:Protein GrpE n=1 Tax=Ligilactobacillus apodemi DSM 16634 = JCM 16172 TaxID=1423724 RepID=A0A0R1U2V4_9LACO|nr:nucleotide exchange factor GrpE [Ligilactobacillus apodemi]KRL84043.1 GrpE protein [Ligilactobacillus apodemi DSM 16634 = JCM 16172]
MAEEEIKKAAAEQTAPDETEIKNDSVDDPKQEETVDEVTALNDQLAELQKKYDELEDRYYRAEAEMANMTKRFKKEQEQLLRYEGQDLARDILPVVDNLTRALQTEVEDEASKQLKQGIDIVARDLDKALQGNNVTKIASLGEVFDPTKHQAVKSVPVEEGQEPETIVQVLQEGYMLKDRVLRPAMVVVAQ